MTDGKRDEWEKKEQRKKRNRKIHKERRGGKERTACLCLSTPETLPGSFEAMQPLGGS